MTSGLRQANKMRADKPGAAQHEYAQRFGRHCCVRLPGNQRPCPECEVPATGMTTGPPWIAGVPRG